jgi:hypothetical protein
MHTDQIPKVLDTAQALAEAVATDGFDAHVDAVAELVAEARRKGVCELLATISLDRHEATVVRERAFGRLVVSYCDTRATRVDTACQSTSERFTVAA